MNEDFEFEVRVPPMALLQNLQSARHWKILDTKDTTTTHENDNDDPNDNIIIDKKQL